MKKMVGVVQGVVKNLDDPENEGRIQLTFPWLSEDQNSGWAAVAVPLAGKNCGQYFMPEIGNEALVAFDQGDFDHPYIIGFLWNGVDTPPEQTNQNRIIKTPGGHTLRFEDKAGEKKIIIESDGGHKIELDDRAHTITIHGDQGTNEITIDTTGGTITIKAGSQVSVQAPQIELTQAAAHPLVLGDQLLTYLNTLVTIFNTHLHAGEMAAGVLPVVPTPPATSFSPATAALISTQVRTG